MHYNFITRNNDLYININKLLRVFYINNNGKDILYIILTLILIYLIYQKNM